MLSKDERDRLCTLYAKTTEGAWYPRATDDEVFMNARYVSTEPGPELYGNETMVHDGRRGMDYAHCDCGKVVCITLLQSPRLADVDDARWDDNTIFIAESHNAFPKLLDAIDALEAERDALAAQVAQHEYAVKAWKEEEVLWKEREAALVARVAELEAALQARQRAVDSVVVKSMEIHSNEEALQTICTVLGWDAGEDVCISAMLAAVDASKRIEMLEAALRDILEHSNGGFYVDHVCREALKGAGDARE